MAVFRDAATPPGPRGGLLAGSLLAYESDRTGFLLRLRDEYGGLAAFDSRTTVVSDPVLAAEILDDHRRYVIAGTFLNGKRSLDLAGEVDPARQLLNPGLRPAATHSLVDLVRLEVGEVLRREVSVGTAVDPLPLLERAMSRAVARFYFADEADVIGDLVGELLDALSEVFGNPMSFPQWMPTPNNLRVRSAYKVLLSRVRLLLRSFADDPGEPSCYVARVARASAMEVHSLARVADLLIGSLLAAQRVPAAGSAWALLRLAESPALVSEGRASPAATRSVALEAMRLHPPTWVLHRTTSRPVALGGYSFGRGHNFLVSPYVIHRDSGLFPDATTFDHRRWLAADAPLERLLLFGRGLHRCPGRHAGIVMVTASLQTILASYDVGRLPGRVTEQARTTLVPDGLQMTFRECRSDAHAVADSSRRPSTR